MCLGFSLRVIEFLKEDSLNIFTGKADYVFFFQPTGEDAESQFLNQFFSMFHPLLHPLLYSPKYPVFVLHGP